MTPILHFARSALSVALCPASRFAHASRLAVCLFAGLGLARAADFARGADVGWLSQMEASGVKFYAKDGTQKDCLALLKSLGIDSIRLRVWVNPTGGWCGQSDVVAMASRASAMGFRILIDFHYSDSWADPGKQNKPAAWAGHTLAQLQTDVANHTTAVLSALKAAGVTPEWVQIGNETNDGMLWEEGRASASMAAFASLVNAGNDAAKAVFPSIKTIVHISNGYDNTLFRWMFDGLKANGARFDVIGMSLYPDPTTWAELDSECLDNMNDMVARYGKPVMICEVGMDSTAVSASHAFLTDIIAKAKAVTGGPALGVFYWEPECYGGWQGYGKGAFDSTGKPTRALEAFAAPASAPGSRLTSISERAYVGTGDNIAVAGFVVSGNSPKQVLIRASGPALAPFKVQGLLADPELELYDQTDQVLIASDDNWGDQKSMVKAIVPTASRLYAFNWPDTTSKDAALLVTLAPGAYTAQVKGVGDTTGVTLIEVYDAD